MSSTLPTLRFLLQVGKITCGLICWIVFFFWGFQAFRKFFSHPISSSITFQNGDDGLGNLTFPAITICVLNFNQYLNQILFKSIPRRCEVPSINDFSHALQRCISLGPPNPDLDTTEDYYGFGHLFGNNDDLDYDLFDSVDEFMNASRIEIFDLIKTFEFGKEIIITKNLGHLREPLLAELWIKSFDSRLGPCFTFDPDRHNATFLSSGTDISGQFEAQKAYLELQFRWFDQAIYQISLHNSFGDRFDRIVRQPYHLLFSQNVYTIKLSKTVFDSLSQANSPCSGDNLYGPILCKTRKAGQKFVEKYNCSLPWLDFEDFEGFDQCPNQMVGQDNETITIFDLVHDWPKIYDSITNCGDLLPCHRVIYEDFIEQRTPSTDFGLNGWISGNDSSLTIQYGNPFLQVIKDSVSYDLQSLIGEVGGTLGLLLGLSFLSIFDLLEHLLNVCFD